ncbi:THUMP-like domain-containing protein [Pedobacter deserti]|uniref:THUMP-like domain-containing protein n=1 Tax=Pedobacter deserti TaxID=2817382 RepID=UPI002109639E|nr:hypothetical protein [Pedobacter sp. SYSU D00382]
MNIHLLTSEVQDYINAHLHDDAGKIALSKSPFANVSSAELANQIAAKRKSRKKLPTWFNTTGICYPPLLSIEQCSSETTATFKAQLAIGESLLDLTGGFGVDSYYFSKNVGRVLHCEINPELSAIASHNSGVLQRSNVDFMAADGMRYLQESSSSFDTIYLDPARRSSSGKVFMLKDCVPDVTTHLDLLLARSSRLIIKTAPLLDLSAGLAELKKVSSIYIVSVKNECKELLWVMDKQRTEGLQIHSIMLNNPHKHFSFAWGEERIEAALLEAEIATGEYLYEPDAAVLKSGAFNLIGDRYGIVKLHQQSQLFWSRTANTDFPGRIFKVERVLKATELKKEKDLSGNVITRNYPERADNLLKKHRIKPDDKRFLIFTKTTTTGYTVFDTTILQHY